MLSPASFCMGFTFGGRGGDEKCLPNMQNMWGLCLGGGGFAFYNL